MKKQEYEKRLMTHTPETDEGGCFALGTRMLNYMYMQWLIERDKRKSASKRQA